MRRAALALAAISLTALAVLAAAGEVLTSPAAQPVGLPPSDLDATAVRIPGGRRGPMAGWFVPGKPGSGVVLLLHGVRSNRLQMVDRARFLKAAGYSSLLVDLPAHGESPGERITFGARESEGVQSSLQFLHTRLPGERIAVIGASLGAASLVLAKSRPPLSAVVLESMYPTITEAVEDRIAIRLGPLGKHLAPLLLWQLPIRIGISESDLRPIEHIAALGSPLLVAAGTEDQHTTWAETVRIFAEASPPKRLWGVPGAGHVDLHRTAPGEYEKRVLDFLAETMR